MLIVDDDRDTRDLMREVLEAEGFATLCSADVAGTVDFLTSGTLPDVALIDFALPDGLGTDLRDRLRTLGVPAVIVSAYPTWLRGSDRPDLDWIPKPFTTLDLVAAVRRHSLVRRRKRDR